MNDAINNIRLNFRCPANWEAMTPMLNGRFCDHCAKVVYDFTDAKQAEFQKILTENAGGICGRFRSAQMAPEPLLLPRWKQWLSAAMLLVGVNLFTQCKEGVKGKVQRDEKPKASQLLGAPLAIPADTTENLVGKPVDGNPTRVKKQEIKFPPPVVMGDVDVRDYVGDSGKVSSKRNDIVQQDTLPAEPQHVQTLPKDDTVFGTVEDNPIFPGGKEAFYKFLQKNLRHTPDMIKGKVFLTFLIKKDGTLNDIKVIRGLSPQNDAEALRVVKLMPKWTPGKRYNKPVDMQYTLPINFE